MSIPACLHPSQPGTGIGQFKNIFSSAENTVSLDSINVSKIYPIFAMDSSEYCKIELIFVVSFFIDAAKEGVPSTK